MSSRAEQGQLVRSAYLAQVRDIAPDALIGRENELADWAEFCAGADPYAWWQAGPWAGKSALASWFVTHPPAGVDVVSFFITGRLSGQADSDAFLDAMIEQLDALDPASREVSRSGGGAGGRMAEPAGNGGSPSRKNGHVGLSSWWTGLMRTRLGRPRSGGGPASPRLLPRRPPPGVRFIVTSRLDPGLPDDVPSVIRCAPASRVACRCRGWPRASEVHAKQELQDLLAGDQIAVDVVGYIAGSGGGLTRGDLSALTGAPPHKLDPVLRGVFGRSLYTRASSRSPRRPGGSGDARVPVRARDFAGHRRGTTRQRTRPLQGKGARMDRVLCQRGWPDTTPGYAIRGYLRLLAATADVTRLSALARDPRRHAFLLGPPEATTRLSPRSGLLRALIADQKVLDLRALVELAAYRHALSIRNQSIPPDLPIVWARLGRFDHAEALARTITDPGAQAQALTGLATRPPRPATRWTAPRPSPAPSPTLTPRPRRSTGLATVDRPGR